jgi:hypothetical protein
MPVAAIAMLPLRAHYAFLDSYGGAARIIILNYVFLHSIILIHYHYYGSLESYGGAARWDALGLCREHHARVRRDLARVRRTHATQGALHAARTALGVCARARACTDARAVANRGSYNCSRPGRSARARTPTSTGAGSCLYVRAGPLAHARTHARVPTCTGRGRLSGTRQARRTWRRRPSAGRSWTLQPPRVLVGYGLLRVRATRCATLHRVVS